MDAHLGRARVHVGAAADGAPEAVAYRVLDAQREEVQTLERAALRGEVDADAARDVEALRPVEIKGGAVDVFFTAVGHGEQAQQHARGDAAFQVGAVEDPRVARERDAAGDGPHRARAEPGEFGGERVFQTARAGCEQLGVGLRGHRKAGMINRRLSAKVT